MCKPYKDEREAKSESVPFNTRRRISKDDLDTEPPFYPEEIIDEV